MIWYKLHDKHYWVVEKRDSFSPLQHPQAVEHFVYISRFIFLSCWRVFLNNFVAISISVICGTLWYILLWKWPYMEWYITKEKLTPLTKLMTIAACSQAWLMPTEQIGTKELKQTRERTSLLASFRYVFSFKLSATEDVGKRRDIIIINYINHYNYN